MIHLFFQYFGYSSLRILKVSVVLILASLIYFFYVPFIEVLDYTIHNPVYWYVKDLDMWVYLVHYFIGISIVNTFVFLILSFFFSAEKEIIARKKKELEFLFTSKLIKYIYNDFLENQPSDKEFLNWFKITAEGKFAHLILFSVITRTQETIAENLSGKFTALIEHLNLKPRLNFFLHSSKMSHKIIALKIISYLRMKGFDKTILKYTESSNYVLRTEAVAAMIRLSESDHLHLLSLQQHMISKLDINIILNAVQKNMKDDIDFESLTASDSARIEAIGIMLIKYKNKKELKHLVKPVLENDDELLHEICWEVFTHMADNEEDYDYMAERFASETDINKMYILKAIKRFHGHEKFHDFLDNVIERESLLLRIQAMKILFEDHFDSLVPYKDSDDENITTAYKEVIDLNIEHTSD